MKKDHAVLDFVKAPIAIKIETGRSVETKMRPNPIFAHPDVPFDDLKESTDLLETRNVAALNGGKEATALLHQTEEDWANKMRLMARYVDRIADGDSAIILGAGFNLAKQPTPAARPEFSVEQGEKSGSVILQRKRVDGARSYIWQQSIDGNEWITTQTTAQASVELTGLTPLTKYWFRVAAVTITGTSDFNDPVTQVVI
ncbi:MAG: fibronectin type III domain-containing protein [Paludibacter sp.]